MVSIVFGDNDNKEHVNLMTIFTDTQLLKKYEYKKKGQQSETRLTLMEAAPGSEKCSWNRLGITRRSSSWHHGGRKQDMEQRGAVVGGERAS